MAAKSNQVSSAFPNLRHGPRRPGGINRLFVRQHALMYKRFIEFDNRE